MLTTLQQGAGGRTAQLSQAQQCTSTHPFFHIAILKIPEFLVPAVGKSQAAVHANDRNLITISYGLKQTGQGGR